MGYMDKDVICSDSNILIPEITPYHFGILESNVHMAWMRVVCGRLKSDYRYSNTIVYNNFPWSQEDNVQGTQRTEGTKGTEATKETKRTEETKGTKVAEATRKTKAVSRSLRSLPSLSSLEGGSNG